ncbi:hypothetical protein THRCLA_05774 [Thraustotheca clavata]|uniref:Uncharacterized protein n=1 Tax=Thraustotheca clavata TaxID=74557 RepID=A0A1V9ZTM8_9STRA|nr:hypothetical protein THRCLA_05774 [Thraustotheca clavata]
MVYARGRWTELEDLQLLTAISAMPNSPWSDVAEWIPTRSPQQVRLRGVRIEKKLCLPKRPRWRNEYERLHEKRLISPFVKNPIEQLVPVEPLTENEAETMIQSFTGLNWKIVTSWNEEGSVQEEEILWEDLVDLENCTQETQFITLDCIEI